MSRRNKNRQNKPKPPKQPKAETLSVKPTKSLRRVNKELPFGLTYFRILGGTGLVATLLGLTIGTSYYWSVVLVYAGATFLMLDFTREPRFGLKSRVLLIVALVVFAGWFTRSIVFNSDKIDASIRAVGTYIPDGTGTVWGIPWQPFYYGVELGLGNVSAPDNYSNVDLLVYSDLPLVEFALTTPGGCEGMSTSRIIDGGELTNLTAQTTQVTRTPNGMAIKCKRIAKGEFLTFLLAMYPLDRNRKHASDLMVPIKPSWVEIKGSFETALGKPHNVLTHIRVPEPERADSIQSRPLQLR